MFAPMVEKAIIVVLHLQWHDFLLNEIVQSGQINADIIRNGKIHKNASLRR
jgi:hypothetical protein